MRAWALAAVLVLGALARSVPAAAPRPAETTPTLCAMAVDPGLALIEVRFDQPMRMDSWSWCGGGENYPEITGSPHFRDAQTAVLPVRLRPRHTYSLMINCPSGQGFRSTAGEPAAATRLWFTTTAAPGQFTVSDPLNAKSWAEFRRLFDTVYSHRDLTGTDWTALFHEATPWMLDAPTADEFALRLSLLLGRAEDIHLRVIRADGDTLGTFRRSNPLNANFDAVERLLPSLQKPHRSVWWARRGTVGYLAIHTWSLDDAGQAAAQEALDAFLDTSALIIDVRANGGGSEDQALAVAGRLHTRPTLYARHRYRDTNSPDGWGAERTRWVHPVPGKPVYTGRVLLLQGPACFSSNESFVKMIAVLPGSLRLGATTGGSSANPRRFPLPNGTAISLPRWQDMLADGTLLERHGIPPDRQIDGDFSVDDPVLRAALEETAN